MSRASSSTSARASSLDRGPEPRGYSRSCPETLTAPRRSRRSRPLPSGRRSVVREMARCLRASRRGGRPRRPRSRRRSSWAGAYAARLAATCPHRDLRGRVASGALGSCPAAPVPRRAGYGSAWGAEGSDEEETEHRVGGRRAGGGDAAGRGVGWSAVRSPGCRVYRPRCAEVRHARGWSEQPCTMEPGPRGEAEHAGSVGARFLLARHVADRPRQTQSGPVPRGAGLFSWAGGSASGPRAAPARRPAGSDARSSTAAPAAP
jgi:hypothetical protein